MKNKCMGARKHDKILSNEVMDAVIGDLYKAQPLMRTLESHEVSAQSFFCTLRSVPLYAEKYALAQDARADLYADEIISIADNEEDPNKARNMINARMWATSKMKPKVYGDRIEMTVNQTVDIRGALDEAKARIRDAIQIPTPQLIESTATIQRDALGLEPNVKPDSNTPSMEYILDLDQED